MAQLALLAKSKNSGVWPTLDLTLPLRQAIGIGKFPRVAQVIIPASVTPQPPLLSNQQPQGPTRQQPVTTTGSGSTGGPIRQMEANKQGVPPQITYNSTAAQPPATGQPGGVKPAIKPIRELGPQ